MASIPGGRSPLQLSAGGLTGARFWAARCLALHEEERRLLAEMASARTALQRAARIACPQLPEDLNSRRGRGPS